LIAIGLLSLLALLVLAATDHVLFRRFVYLPATVAIVFVGLAAGGWLSEPAGRLRTVWAACALAVVVAGFSLLPSRIDQISEVRAEARTRSSELSDLRAIVTEHGQLFDRCPHVYAPSFAVKPPLAYYADRRPDAIELAEFAKPRTGVAVLPAHRGVAAGFWVTGFPYSRVVREVSASLKLTDANASWQLYSRGC
jgi:hypothetical protein